MTTTDATDGALGTTNITVPVTHSLVAVTVTWPGRRALTYPAVDTVAIISLRPHAAAKAIAAHPRILTTRSVTGERLRQLPGRHGALDPAG